jgi:hypothetical protein
MFIVNAHGREAPTKWVRLDNMYVRVKIYKIIRQTYRKKKKIMVEFPLNRPEAERFTEFYWMH